MPIKLIKKCKKFMKWHKKKKKNKNDKRRIYKKRNTISMKSGKLLNLKKFSIEKNEDLYEDSYLDIYKIKIVYLLIDF